MWLCLLLKKTAAVSWVGCCPIRQCGVGGPLHVIVCATVDWWPGWGGADFSRVFSTLSEIGPSLKYSDCNVWRMLFTGVDKLQRLVGRWECCLAENKAQWRQRALDGQYTHCHSIITYIVCRTLLTITVTMSAHKLHLLVSAPTEFTLLYFVCIGGEKWSLSSVFKTKLLRGCLK